MISISKPGRCTVARVVSSSICWFDKHLLPLDGESQDANPKAMTGQCVSLAMRLELWSDYSVRSLCPITDGGFNVLGNGLQALR
jgi:hypothetical protein